MLHAAILALALRATQPVEVFVGGAGGYPVYRIPSVTRLETGAAKGRLLAFAEAHRQVHLHLVPRHEHDDASKAWALADLYRAVAAGGRAPASPEESERAFAAIATKALMSRT